ncbi:hypothetical protein TNCV_5113361 [Trichonephila clavipes]|nr:hypothetical protein TNCV_5113361 [Trichonephila clavipes]
MSRRLREKIVFNLPPFRISAMCIVSCNNRYGSPALKPLTPQLVSVQSARRCFSSAFWIPGQHHGTTLWDSPLRFLKPTSPRLFRALFLDLSFRVTSSIFSFPGLLSSPEKEPS